MTNQMKAIAISCLFIGFSVNACELKNKNKNIKMTESEKTYSSSWNDAKQSKLLKYISPRNIHAEQSIVQQTRKTQLQIGK